MRKRHVLACLTATTTVAMVAALGLGPPPAGGSELTNGRPASASSQMPTRVLFIVLDQLRPAFIDAFHMRNVKALMAHGTRFSRAYLGHMGAETVVSHNVMTSGQLPKHMGWTDEWYRDTAGVLGAPDQQCGEGSTTGRRSRVGRRARWRTFLTWRGTPTSRWAG